MSVLSLVDTSGAVCNRTIYHNLFEIGEGDKLIHLKPVKCSCYFCFGVTIDGHKKDRCISCLRKEIVRDESQYWNYFKTKKTWKSFCVSCNNMNYINWDLIQQISNNGKTKIIVYCGICQYKILQTTTKNSKFYLLNNTSAPPSPYTTPRPLSRPRPRSHPPSPPPSLPPSPPISHPPPSSPQSLSKIDYNDPTYIAFKNKQLSWSDYKD